jgi:hypothetical protein
MRNASLKARGPKGRDLDREPSGSLSPRRHREGRSDEAIQGPRGGSGLLRFARNDGREDPDQ